MPAKFTDKCVVDGMVMTITEFEGLLYSNPGDTYTVRMQTVEEVDHVATD